MKNAMLTGLLVAAAIGAVFAQTSAGRKAAPVADGVMKDGEYRLVQSFADIKLGLYFSADGKTLHAAIEAPTTGWVAVGLGSQVMNGAYIVLGAYSNGKGIVTEQQGFGHGHADQTVKMVSSSAVSETGGKTVMEFAIPAAQFVRGSVLQLALSYGATDNFSERHVKHVSGEIPLPLR